MSYCRWSDDNWRSDIYAYESADGYAIHVGSMRIVGEVPPLPKNGAFVSEEWWDAYRIQAEFVRNAERQPIGMPHDGKFYLEPTLDEFEARLQWLQDAGYRMPAWVFDLIHEERKEAEHDLQI
jgi:hypothetical protein